MSANKVSQARAGAVADLFTALERLILSYQFTPDDQREAYWAADAERITGEISRHLAATRARLSPSFDPAQVVVGR